MQFVDVTNDVAFRKIFGNEKKTVILISFLNAILQLEGKNRIKSITIKDPYQPPILQNFKASIIDVRAKDFKGNTFIVEMQVADTDGMDKRLLYYTSKEIVSGEKYTELKPVIFIGIFDFKFTKSKNHISHHAICNVETQERVIKDMDFYFIELPKFKKSEAELESITDKWIYFIKKADTLDVVPENTNDKGLKAAYSDANKHTWSKEELDAYDYAGIRAQDARGAISKANRVGREEGREEAEKEILLKLHAKNISLEEISELLEIPLDKVNQIIGEVD